MWQTRRADEVARRIRQAERRESALYDLYAVVASVEGRMAALNRQVQRGQTALSTTRRSRYSAGYERIGTARHRAW